MKVGCWIKVAYDGYKTYIKINGISHWLVNIFIDNCIKNACTDRDIVVGDAKYDVSLPENPNDLQWLLDRLYNASSNWIWKLITKESKVLK